MKKKIITALKITAFFAVGVFIFWLAYRGQDFGTMFESIKNTKWSWIIFSLILGLIGHYSRGMRWRLLLEPCGYKPKDSNMFASVMIMYLANMAIPRSGEFIRCGVTSKYEKIPFAVSFGTVVTERIADMLIFLALTIIVFVTQGDIVDKILEQNPGISEKLSSLGNYVPTLIIIGVACLVLGLLAVRLAIKKNIFGIGEKINSVIKNFKDGVLTILKMKKRWQFVFHTLFINFVYYFDIYLAFKAFSFTENLTSAEALTVFVLSTYGVLVPSPGGMGTWHFIAIQLLALYGIAPDPDGRAWALVTHSVQDVTFLIGGFALLMLMPIINKNYQPQTANGTIAQDKESN